ncbi:MAG: hypothetical protein KDA97_06430, partial [Acidimicrobiales bacterium]|nr:hypothetical protein [Acidimicrobiales bacterium]
ASRIVNLAFPGSVVCSSEVHDAMEGRDDITWKSIGTRRLKDIGKAQLYVVRRAGTEERPKSSRQRDESRRAERREARLEAMEDEG